MGKKGRFLRILSTIMGITTLFLAGCGGGKGEHTHVFDRKVKEEQYLKSAETCMEAKQYYYSCACGEKGEESFKDGDKGKHNYTEKIAEKKYERTPATCLNEGEYYLSCCYCGASSKAAHLTFTAGGFGEHCYDKQVAYLEYLASEATYESAATYYKSCICGLKGTETFNDVGPLRDLTDEEKSGCQPTTLTMTLYDAENSVYGFTYHTKERPMRPVIQISKGSSLNNVQEIGVRYTQASSYEIHSSGNDRAITYYVGKAEIELEPLTTYTYRIYDKYADVGSERTTFTTKDTQSSSFSFAHVSDSQTDGEGGAACFASVLDNLDVNFLLHTGDVVEYGRYEHEWTEMLHKNAKYLSKLPMMVAGGNHDVGTYRKAGNDELTKHFNHKIPKQTTTMKGYYYSFTYGNAKFIVLNTNEGGNEISGEQYNWLISELENNDKAWTFVAMHAPLYAVGQWGADPEKNEQSMALRTQLGGIFAEYGVDIVFQGHDHLISRTNPIIVGGTSTTELWETQDGIEYSVDPNGVIYVMDGRVGKSAKSVIGVEGGIYKYATTSSQSTWADVKINGNTLTFQVKYCSGNTVSVLQKWGIKKSA